MDPIVVLEWKFSPLDYFEAPIEISQNDYTMIIADGNAEVKMDSAIYEADHSIRDALHDELNGRFLCHQLSKSEPFNLSSPTMSRVEHNDGRKDHILEVESTPITLKNHSVTLLKNDKDGNVVADDETEKAEKLADLVSKHREDKTLMLLLESYHASKKDPDDELVHLYEIRDALHRKFGNDKAALSTLEKFRLTRNDWKDFGNLVNKASLRQGRHRGQSDGALCDATDGELFNARRIAGTMIEAYLRYLDETADSSGPK